MMKLQYQQFRRAGVIETVCVRNASKFSGNDNSSYYISLQDIRDVFPDAMRFKLGELPIPFLVDPNGNRIEPPRIAYYPYKILDVVTGVPRSSNTNANTNTNTNSSSSNTSSNSIKSSSNGKGSSKSNSNAAIRLPALRKSVNLTTQDPLLPLSNLIQCLNSFLTTPDNAQIETINSNLAMIAELLLEASEKDAKISLLEAKEKDNKMTNLVEAKEKDDRIINLLMEASEKDAKINLLEAKVKDSKMINEKIANLQLELKEKDDEIINMLLKSKEKDGEMLKIQDEMLKLRLEARKKGGEMETKKKDDEMQAQALNNLTMHQKHAHSILTQDFELHECPFPRLFIILPLNCTKWDPVKLLGNKFRVHFLCECGDYTAMANKPNPGQIHIARHDGYEVRDCTGFFRKYGKYMLILLHWLKLGMALPDSLAPDPSLIDAGIDYSIDYLQALSKKYPALNKISTINDFEGLKKTELRQLGTSFRITDGNKDLGNLYRVTTETGYVKWVCHNHYRSMYKEKRQKAFEDVVKMNNAKYDSHLGKLVIKLGSKARAEEFFNVLTNAGRVYELDITFDWDWAESDLEAFENILKVSNVSILRLGLGRLQENVSGEPLPPSMRYEILVRIIEFCKMKLIHIVLTSDLTRLLTLRPKRPPHLPQLHKLSFEMSFRSIGASEFQALINLLKANTALATLVLGNNSVGNERAVILSEALKVNTTLTALDLKYNSIGTKGALALAGALKTNRTLTSLDLRHNYLIGDEGASALLGALKTNTALTLYK